jgi:CBS domain-containing protein
MKAEDVMARDVLTVTPATSIKVALALMLQRKISGLPVLDAKGHIAGILTEGDLLHRTETGTGGKLRSKLMEFLAGPGREAAEYVKTHSRVVGDLMTTDVISVRHDSDLSEIVALMESKHIRRVPVTQDGRLVGIVSRADLLRVIARQLDTESDTHSSDVVIEAALKAELSKADWTTSSNIGVNVDAGIVTYNGFVYDERTRQALMVAAQNTPGVKSVIDQLVCLDVATGMVVP